MQDLIQLFKEYAPYAVAAALSVVLACLLVLAFISRRLQALNIPPQAGYFESLRRVPIILPICLDILDAILDVFALPIVWVFLGRHGLYALRRVTSVEALIPGTQLLPTLTLSWIAARLMTTQTERDSNAR